MNREDLIKRLIIYGVIIVFLGVILFFNRNYENKAPLPVSTSEYRMNLDSDISRLECIFEQRKCYYEWLGHDKIEALKVCGDLNFCHERFKK